MPRLVLTDGRIITTTREQQDKLAMVILMATDFTKSVRVGREHFRLDQIETDHKKIMSVGQGKMFDVTPVAVDKKRNRKELA